MTKIINYQLSINYQHYQDALPKHHRCINLQKYSVAFASGRTL